MRRFRRHALPVLAFAVMAVGWSFPLIAHLSTHVPGPAGDNLSFLWDFWWMRTALATGADVFRTTFLFAPVGVNLALHTHLALPAFVGATILSALPLVATQNATILAALFLNGFCAYLLAWRLTGERGPSLIAGLVYGGSPFVAGHLGGHFNLISAWTLPLVALAVENARRGSRVQVLVAGLVIGATAYLDYYFVVFGFALALVLALLPPGGLRVTTRRPAGTARRLSHAIGWLLLADVIAMAAIAGTGGFDLRWGAIHLSAHDLFNPLQAFWLLLYLLVVVRWRPSVTSAGGRSAGLTSTAIRLTAIAAVFLMVAAPLVWHAAALMTGGDYVTQTYFWRSAPKGVDAASLILGNPFNGLWGAVVQRWYAVFGINAIESTGWLGVVPAAVAAIAIRRAYGAWNGFAAADAPHAQEARRWTAVGAVFFLWALGPHLMAFGANTGAILPQAVLRYLPVVNNARMPGRAMILVYLAVAVLVALALSGRREAARRRLATLAVVAALVAVDFVPAPFPLTAVQTPLLYATLRDRPETGALCELPMGVRDGFGAVGAMDDRVLLFQTVHGRPLVGGYISRVPASVAETYQRDALLSALLWLSAPDPSSSPPALPDRALAAERLEANGIAFVVLDRSLAGPGLTRFVDEVLPLTLVEADGERSLYVVSR